MKTISETPRAAFYARVSSDRQAAEGTIASQLEALRHRIAADGLVIDDELGFIDDGCSGSTLLRPALERLRDQAAAGAIDRLYVLDPDRLARNYAWQVLLLQELEEAGVAAVFVNRPLGATPEDALLLQVQGVIAEYERAKVRERCRRGKLFAARAGSVAVLGRAPYGYRYVPRAEGGGTARYDIVFEEARVVRQVFAWVGQERVGLREVARRLVRQGVASPAGKGLWQVTTLARLLANPAYRGEAAFGTTRVGPWRPRRPRPPCGRPAVPQRPATVTPTEESERISIAVPALVDAALWRAANAQVAENRRRLRARRSGARHLLAGLVVCGGCGYALCGWGYRRRTAGGTREYRYYQCRQHRAAGLACRCRPVAAAGLEQAVWEDVCRLLAEPSKIAAEYERRLRGDGPESGGEEAGSAARRAGRLKRTIARLIDAYSEGLLEKEEFEPRLRAARERLAALEAEARAATDAEACRAELRLALGCLEEFAEQVRRGLEAADVGTRRAILRALVRVVEVGEEEIRVVYRIAPPFPTKGADGTFSQDCCGRRNE